MALQGTIDTFALADVLRLLGSTAKTGRLTLDGDRGRGEVLVVDGMIKGLAIGEDGSFDRQPADEAMFELLRFGNASFVFDADEGAREQVGESVEVEPLLVEAEAILEEWIGIEKVMPSTDAWVSIASELPAPQVTIDAERWRLLALIGSGTTAAGLATSIDTTELAVGRIVRNLFDLGVIEVGAAASGAAVTSLPTRARSNGSAPVAPESPAAEALAAEAEEPASPPSSWFEDAPLTQGDGLNGQVLPAEHDVLVEAEPVRTTDFFDAEDDTSAAEFARHLASLSPKAAQAVAAAARAETPEARDAALAEVASSDESIDHDLLLRFLGDTAS